jgi:NADH-quinone oxidoreductase subunit H
MDWIAILILLVRCLVLALAATTLFAYFTLFERRLLARFQNRVGPNRAGYIPLPGGKKLFGGILQPAADAVKLFFKEDVIPTLADRWVYLMAPGFAVVPALIIWVAIPLGNWPDGSGGNWLHYAPIDVGILYLLAVTSIGVYGIAVAGWASNNKYSMLGGIRASAQVISYELALGLSILGVVMQSGTLRTEGIVNAQIGMWNIVPQFMGFIIFLIASTAEVVRSPFDLVEAEQELVGGYNTEYGSMKFALFFMSEYIKLIAMNAIAVTLFLGGGNLPGIEQASAAITAGYGVTAGNAAMGLMSLGAFLIKTTLLSFLSVWIRATVPRVRYDQLMNLGWVILLPLALLNVIITAVFGVVFPVGAVVPQIAMGVIGLIVIVLTTVLAAPKRTKRGVTLVRSQARN